jgi:hypothetical protein
LVDLRDFAIWRSSFGETGEGLAADFDKNGIIDFDDYRILVSNLGKIISFDSQQMASGAELPPESVSAPEPASLMLLVLTVWPVLRRRRSQ